MKLIINIHLKARIDGVLIQNQTYYQKKSCHAKRGFKVKTNGKEVYG